LATGELRSQKEITAKILWYSKYSFNCRSLTGESFPGGNYAAKEN